MSWKINMIMLPKMIKIQLIPYSHVNGIFNKIGKTIPDFANRRLKKKTQNNLE